MRSSSSRFLRGRARLAAAVALSGALLAAGCGGGGVQGGSLTQQVDPVDLGGETYTVGGKQGETEEILCEIAGVALQSVGAEVNQRCGLGDTKAARQALVSGGIDLYWEQTGTAWTTLLGQQRISGMSAQYRAVQKKDEAENKVVWLEPAWLNETDAFAVDAEKAKELKLRSLADMAEYLKSDKPGTLCVDGEYQRDQAGGLPGLQRAYEFSVPQDRQRVLPAAEIYQATAGGQDCLFGKVAASDPRVVGQGLTTLADNKDFHPAFNDAVTIRKDVYDRNQDIARVFTPVSRKLTNAAMSGMRQEMAQGKSAHEAAVGWLRAEGFIEGGD